ncbi:DEDD exonuclease domain-containing protein [uncultured Corynebacterium sp.]|uniref:DEDD exonuclease domain-containing protein n=1 Tax=uncultured Corynebacterium sp. TaxID=159447 RepID=UPI0025E6705A|nr:DEDD exonuclease domain-containing protein [uncultured Corynebacterium sp.]
MNHHDPLQLSLSDARFGVVGDGGAREGAVGASGPAGFREGAAAGDPAIGELGLGETTFVVVDLETTGMRAPDDHIIEIGAVRVRGGVEEGRFSELIDPGIALPDVITRLTGITDRDLDGAPQLGTVLPKFLEFARGAVWVAHNAPFDIGFLRASCTQLGLPWPAPTVIDTLTLARRLLDRKRTGSFRLGDLARYVGAQTTPNHRALDDAAATVEVLHHLIERLAGHRVSTVGELEHFSPEVDPRLREKKALIDDAPHRPGVYVFRGPGGDPLYIGTAVDLRRRLLQYFTGADPRRRMREMVMLAEAVDLVECAHGMEAEVREARMLAAARPPYNRQRKEPGRGWYLNPPTRKSGPRVSRVAESGGTVIGPFRTRNAAQETKDALSLDADNFGEISDELDAGGAAAIERLVDEVSSLAEAGRYRRAAFLRDVTAELILTLDRRQRLGALAAIPQLQAAFPDGRGGWHLAVVRHGRLAAAGTSPRGADAAHVARLLAESAETVIPGDGPYLGASPHELQVVHNWLLRDDVRIGPTDAAWTSPAAGAGKWRRWANTAIAARKS